MSPHRPRRQRYASIIVVPPQRDQPFNFNMPGWAYYLLLGGIAALLAIVIGGFFLTGWMGMRLRQLRQVEARNIVLEEEAAKVAELERELERLEDLRLRILDLAGIDVREEIEARTAERVGEVVEEQTVAGIASPAGPVLASPSTKTRGTMPSMWPVEGVISRGFTDSGEPSKLHYGMDIAAAHRAKVHASGAGMVVFAGRDSVFGLMVVIEHGRDVMSYYGHNSMLEVGRGDRVKRGDVIARVGSTGESTAPHLHFEVRKKGNPINPRSFFVD